MTASDATAIPIKNSAYRVYFPILDADGDLVEGALGLDSEISKDGGTFVNCTNEATELATHVHDVDDTTNTVTTPDAVNEVQLIDLVNEIKSDYNAHRVSTTFHDVADSTNDVTSANASDLATSMTLANEIKTDYNAHRSQSGVHPHDDDGNDVTSADGTDLATTITLANEIKGDYNAHLVATQATSGMLYLDLTATEMNADTVILVIKSTTTGAKTTPMVLYPAEDTDIIVNVKAISDDTTAPDNLELDYDGTGYNKSNSTIGTTTTNTDMIGTNNAALATDLTTAQNDLDTITGADGVTLATAQALYAPNTVIPDAAGVAPTAVEIRTEMEGVGTKLTDVLTDTSELQTNQGNWLTATGFNTVVPDAAGTAATLHTTTDALITTIDNVVDAIKTKTDNLPSGITKGEALPKFDFLMILSDHYTAAVGKIVSGEISKDGGSFTAITNSITEVSSGMYTIASGLTQTEMNADIITLKFNEIDCDTRIITMVTN